MMLTDIYYPELSNKWKQTLYDFAVKTNKTDIEDYIESGKWKSRKGASGLETRNVRGGIHCAILAHETIGTVKTGAVRVSINAFNTKEEIYKFINVIKEL